MTNLFTASRELREIASKVSCLPPPNHRNPNAFHEARSEQADAIRKVADQLWPEPKNGSTITDVRRPTPPNTQSLPRSPRRK